MRTIVVWLIVVWLAFPAAAQDVPLPDLPGRIAFVGTDFNVYTVGADGEPVALTDSAGVVGDAASGFRFPTWSTDGRLAYFGVTVDPAQEQLTTEVYISPDGVRPGTLAYSGENEAFNYAYWAPQDCADGDNCRDLAVLLGGSRGLFVQLVRDGETPASTQAGTGSPFYYSWSPDGTRMLWQRSNQRLDVYDVAADIVTATLPQLPGTFSSPGWSPVDDRFLFGAQGADETTDLVVVANEAVTTLASALPGYVAFAWSPNGNHVAYTNDGGALVVLDALTGETVTRSPVTGVYGFFWSPDSRLLAYITLATPPGSFNARGTGGVLAAQTDAPAYLIWSTLDVETGEVRRFSPFMPTRDMLYYLAYFDQFAQSHRLWAPDSRHLIYTEVTLDNQQVVTLLDVTSPDSVPLSIAEGAFAVWSFN